VVVYVIMELPKYILVIRVKTTLCAHTLYIYTYICKHLVWPIGIHQ